MSFLIEAIPRLTGYYKSDKEKSYLSEFLKEQKITVHSIKKWAFANHADYHSVKSINDQKAVGYLKENSPRWLIYCGGGIIRNEIIEVMDGRILNAHQGPLPQVRGTECGENGPFYWTKNRKQPSTS